MKSLWNDNTCTNNFIFYYLDGPYEEDDGDATLLMVTF